MPTCAFSQSSWASRHFFLTCAGTFPAPCLDRISGKGNAVKCQMHQRGLIEPVTYPE